jgi:hypothetical protein
MSSQETPKSAKELLKKAWELTEQSMALIGLQIPLYIRFQIGGARHIRPTRVAELDELAKAIGTIDEDIGRLVRGAPALSYASEDIEQLRRDKSALTELQKRALRSGCPKASTVIESLFPDIPIKKKTESEKAEIEQWLAARREEGLKIDPETAETEWWYAQTLDPYGVDPDLPDEFWQVGREYFASSPGSDIWVSFRDLPDATRERLWEKRRRELAFPAGFEGMGETLNGPDLAESDATLPGGANTFECADNERLGRRNAFEAHVGEWIDQHPSPSTPGACAWCREAETPYAEVLPFGTKPGTHTWLHGGCWTEWYQSRREEAIAALASGGIFLDDTG